MGKTDTSLFTLHKKNTADGKQTLQSLPKVLQRMLEKDSYNALQIGNPQQLEPDLLEMRKQDHEYLDGILNLEHHTKIDITKRGKG